MKNFLIIFSLLKKILIYFCNKYLVFFFKLEMIFILNVFDCLLDKCNYINITLITLECLKLQNAYLTR